MPEQNRHPKGERRNNLSVWTGRDGVVPLGDGLVAGDVECFHLLVADLDAGGVFVPVEPGGHHQASAGGSGSDVVEDQIEGLQRAARPIAADLAEEAMFDRVPF